MATYFYGAGPALAWIISHYFYGQHYCYLSGEYYPYRLPNPKSSNPHLIYQDLYQPWRDRDVFDKMVLGYRLALRKGVLAQEHIGTISTTTANRVKDICDQLDIAFFYPIVYRVDLDQIDASRHHVAGSGLVGSSEVLLTDLKDTEFDILFLDDTTDPDLLQLVTNEVLGISLTSAADALVLLEGRC